MNRIQYIKSSQDASKFISLFTYILRKQKTESRCIFWCISNLNRFITLSSSILELCPWMASPDKVFIIWVFKWKKNVWQKHINLKSKVHSAFTLFWREWLVDSHFRNQKDSHWTPNDRIIIYRHINGHYVLIKLTNTSTSIQNKTALQKKISNSFHDTSYQFRYTNVKVNVTFIKGPYSVRIKSSIWYYHSNFSAFFPQVITIFLAHCETFQIAFVSN